MNLEETGRILGLCASYDNRNTDDSVTYAWFRVIGDLPYGECETAVIAHYTESREWVMPADVRRRARRQMQPAADREQLRQILDPAAYRESVEKADEAFMRKLAERTGGLELKAVPDE